MSWIEEIRNTVHCCGALKTLKAVLVSFFEVLIPQYTVLDTVVLWLEIPFQMLR